MTKLLVIVGVSAMIFLISLGCTQLSMESKAGVLTREDYLFALMMGSLPVAIFVMAWLFRSRR